MLDANLTQRLVVSLHHQLPIVQFLLLHRNLSLDIDQAFQVFYSARGLTLHVDELVVKPQVLDHQCDHLCLL